VRSPRLPGGCCGRSLRAPGRPPPARSGSSLRVPPSLSKSMAHPPAPCCLARSRAPAAPGASPKRGCSISLGSAPGCIFSKITRLPFFCDTRRSPPSRPAAFGRRPGRLRPKRSRAAAGAHGLATVWCQVCFAHPARVCGNGEQGVMAPESPQHTRGWAYRAAQSSGRAPASFLGPSARGVFSGGYSLSPSSGPGPSNAKPKHRRTRGRAGVVRGRRCHPAARSLQVFGFIAGGPRPPGGPLLTGVVVRAGRHQQSRDTSACRPPLSPDRLPSLPAPVCVNGTRGPGAGPQSSPWLESIRRASSPEASARLGVARSARALVTVCFGFAPRPVRPVVARSGSKNRKPRQTAKLRRPRMPHNRRSQFAPYDRPTLSPVPWHHRNARLSTPRVSPAG
jgi:hypothetical protein